METSVLCRLNSAVEKYGDKIAYKDPENSLTFSQFNELTRSIGTYLARLVPAGAPVVVMSGRHIFTPACFLGAVRAGCFYAPMDGDMPVTRLNQILGVIKADFMLVDKAHLDIAQGLDFRGTIIVMEDIIDYPASDELLEQREKTLICTSPLYVIFTSGSTGVPKGVITSHQSLMTYIDSVSKVLDINDTDVLGNQSPLDYIAAIRDIYFPISRGASTFVIPKNEFAVPTALFETLNREPFDDTGQLVLAFNEESHYSEMRRVLKADNGCDCLVGSAVDQHSLLLFTFLYLVDEELVCENHYHSRPDEKECGEKKINSQSYP